MKKFTLAAAMVLGAAAYASALNPTTPPEVSTMEDPKTYVIINYRGYPVAQTPACVLNGPDDYGSTATTWSVSAELTVPESAFWYFVEGEEEGSVKICNAALEYSALESVTGNVDDFDYAIDWYIIQNNVNECGLVMSTQPTITAGATCIDAANFKLGLSGGWSPSAGDWQGTCWIFLPADMDAEQDALVEEIIAAYNDSHFGPLKTNAYAAIDAYTKAIPFGKDNLDGVRTEIEDMKAAPGADLAALQTEINEKIGEAASAALEATVAEMNGKWFSISSMRRDNLMAQNPEFYSEKYKGGFLGAAKFYTTEGGDIDEETGEVYEAPDTIWHDGFNTYAEVYSYCQFQAIAAEDGFMFKNYNGQYIGQLPSALSYKLLAVEDEAEAGIFTLSVFTTGANSGIVFIGANAYIPEDVETPYEGEYPIAFNIDTNGNPLVCYYAADGGSTWALAEVDPNSVEATAADNANAPVEFYNIQGIRVNGAAQPGLYIRRQGNNVTKILVK